MRFNAHFPRLCSTFFRARCDALDTLSYLPRASRLAGDGRARKIYGRSWAAHKVSTECLFCAAAGLGLHQDDTRHLLSGHCYLVGDLFRQLWLHLREHLIATYSRPYRPRDPLALHPSMGPPPDPLPGLVGASTGHHLYQLLQLAANDPRHWGVLLWGDSQDLFLPWLCPRLVTDRGLDAWLRRVHRLPDVISRTTTLSFLQPAMARRERCVELWCADGGLSTLKASSLSAGEKAFLVDLVAREFPGAPPQQQQMPPAGHPS